VILILITIGERLKSLRIEANLKQSDVANITGISTSNISRIEKNEISPSAKMILQICKSFSVSTDWLLTGEEKNYIHDELTKDEKQIITAYRCFDIRGRAAILNAIIYEQDKLEAIDGSREVIDKHVPVITNGIHKNKEERRERDETSEELAISDRIYGMDSLVKR